MSREKERNTPFVKTVCWGRIRSLVELGQQGGGGERKKR